MWILRAYKFTNKIRFINFFFFMTYLFYKRHLFGITFRNIKPTQPTHLFHTMQYQFSI